MTIFEIRAVEKGVLSGFSSIRDYSFSTCAKFSKKLTSLTPWYAHVGNCLIGNSLW